MFKLKKNIAITLAGALLVASFAQGRVDYAGAEGKGSSGNGTITIDTPSTETGISETSIPSATPTATPTATPAPGTFKASIPDDTFRSLINKKYFDSSVKDSTIMSDSMKKTLGRVTGKLNISNENIVNIKGIEYFTGINELDCGYNQIQILDLSQLTNLEVVNADYNDILDVEIAENSGIKTFSCRVNALKTLDLSKAKNLEVIKCSDNQLQELKVPEKSKITYLECSNNELSTLSFENMTALESVYCHGNQLAGLDMSKLTALKHFSCLRSVLSLKMQTIGSNYGVKLPDNAITPNNISGSGALDETNKAIVWSKLSSVPASFTYEYKVIGSDYIVKVIVNVDKSEFAEKLIKVDGVKNLKTTSKAYNKIGLSWDPVDSVSGYRIYRSTSKTSGFSKIKDITVSNKTTYNNSGTACGTKYYYKVRAYRKVDGINYYGEYSSIVEGKSVPAKVTGLKVAKSSKKTVKITYKKVTGASGYRVYRSTSKSTGFSTFKTVTSGSKLTFKKKTGRKVTYYYKVRAYTTVSGKKIWGGYSAVKSKKLA